MTAKAVTDASGAGSVARVLVRPEKGPRAIRGVEELAGDGRWHEVVAGHRFTVSAPSFFQVNTGAAETLVRLAVGAVSPSDGMRVLDAYSGVGTFSLPLAAAGARVVAVESNGWAVRDLRRNAEEAEADIEVQPGDVARAVPGLGDFDTVVVDPPRAGLTRGASDALVGAGAGRIVYVSCDPATLARDTATLAASGYALASVQPIDLFPQTYHVETVAAFDLV
jgi:23S rRNA (uracil1939-C5)-methyltransferase